MSEQVNEITNMNKQDVDHSLKQKIEDINFNKREILKQRKGVCTETDNLLTYNERIMDAMASLKIQALQICQKCIIFREGRLGIDLVRDRIVKIIPKMQTIYNLR